jgi:hypothetical protein
MRKLDYGEGWDDGAPEEMRRDRSGSNALRCLVLGADDRLNVKRGDLVSLEPMCQLSNRGLDSIFGTALPAVLLWNRGANLQARNSLDRIDRQQIHKRRNNLALETE